MAIRREEEEQETSAIGEAGGAPEAADIPGGRGAEDSGPKLRVDIFDQLPVGVLLVDDAGVIRRSNRAADELFGKSLRGTSVDELVPDAVRPRHPDLRSSYTEAPDVRSLGRRCSSIRGRHASGREFAVDVALSPYSPGVTLALVTDVTAVVELNRQLADERDALATSNKELERFAYVASHDLQEPLRMVRSFAHILRTEHADSLDEDGMEALRFLVEGAQRAQALVNAFLSLSRLQTKKTPAQEVDVGELMHGVEFDHRQRIQELGALVIIDDQMPPAFGDPGQIRQVFANLVANALKFGRPGVPPEIIVTATAAGPGRVQYSVMDNGVGVRPRDQDRIFGIFERSREARKVPGSGIGLALAKKIVDRHGGRIWCRPRGDVDHGTVFHVILPAPPGPQP